MDVVEFHGGVYHASRGRGIGLQAVVVSGRQDKAAFGAKFIQQRDRQRRFLSGPIGKAASQLTELSWKSADYIRFKTSGRA